ncbi:MAG: hypothetical protein M3P11_07695 [Actinomycetota bacterium]|nr:hypothetical protein [Actinomycetota bacterium]
MIGVIATLAAFGVIATLMVVGIRTKLPPPDPNWRDHVPPDPPPRSRLWWWIWFGRLPMWLAVITAAAFRARRLALGLGIVIIAMTLASVAERSVVAIRLHKTQRESR